MPTQTGERLIAFEAALQELATLQNAAARYQALARDAEALFGELQDLGRELRHATRRGIFTETVVDEAVGRIRALRVDWHRRLADLRDSYVYRRSLEAYAAGDQSLLAELLPALFVGLARTDAAPPLYQPLVLTSHRRTGTSPFRTPASIAESIAAMRREGLRPRRTSGEWWDTDFPALLFSAARGEIDSPAAIVVERVVQAAELFREGEQIVAFADPLAVEIAVELADDSDDAWYEAAEGSYAAYRDALADALHREGVDVRILPAWS